MIRFEMGEEVIIKYRNIISRRARIIGIQALPESSYPRYRVEEILPIFPRVPFFAVDNKQFCKYSYLYSGHQVLPHFRIYKLEEV